jgi:hypothetical protein
MMLERFSKVRKAQPDPQLAPCVSLGLSSGG